MFFDFLVEKYLSELRNPKLGPRAHQRDLLTPDKERLIAILRKSHLFLINGAVADDLANIPSEATNYEAAFHLPYDIIFFEFMDAILIDRPLYSQGARATNTLPLKAILMGKFLDILALPKKNLEEIVKIGGHQMRSCMGIILFYDEPTIQYLPDEILFHPKDFKEFQAGITQSSVLVSDGRDYSSAYNNSMTIASFRIMNLVINIIDYINSHNVTIHRVDRVREANSRRSIPKEEPIQPLKPYHWIDVKQHVVYHKEELSNWHKQERAYQEMVRGHFQRYHTIDGGITCWVGPYRRGPVDAPWKDTRHRVLYDKLMKGFTLKINTPQQK